MNNLNLYYTLMREAAEKSMADGGIHIKKENEGKFTEWAKSHGMSVQEAASHVLANKDNYSSTIVKRANFAKNASHWNKEEGGAIDPTDPRIAYYQSSAKLAYYKELLNDKLKAKNPQGYTDYFKGLGDLRRAAKDTTNYVQNTPYNDYLTPQEVQSYLGDNYADYLASVRSVNSYEVAQGKQPLYGSVEGEGQLENLNYGRRFASLAITPSYSRKVTSDKLPDKNYRRDYKFNPSTGVTYTESGDMSIKPEGFKKGGTKMDVGVDLKPATVRGPIDLTPQADTDFAVFAYNYNHRQNDPVEQPYRITYPWQKPLVGFNALANFIAGVKTNNDAKEYDRRQQFMIQQPEVTGINKDFRYGTFEVGGSVGSLFDSVLGISNSVGAITSPQNISPADIYTSKIVTGSPDIPAESNEPVSDFSQRIADIESKGMGYKAEARDKKTGKLVSSAAGKYQFLWNTHKADIERLTGVSTKQGFLDNPNAQEAYFKYWDNTVLTPNAQALLPIIQEKYPGITIDQVKAAIHFAGAAGVRKAVKSGNFDKPLDGFGTTLSSYLKAYKQ